MTTESSEWRLPEIPSQVISPTSELAKALPNLGTFLNRLPATLQTFEKNSSNDNRDPFAEIDFAKSLRNHLLATASDVVEFEKNPRLVVELGDALWNVFVISVACSVNNNNNNNNSSNDEVKHESDHKQAVDLRWLRLLVGVIHEFVPCHAILQLKLYAVMLSRHCVDYSSCLALFWGLELQTSSESG